jgi:hypothetical protein
MTSCEHRQRGLSCVQQQSIDDFMPAILLTIYLTSLLSEQMASEGFPRLTDRHPCDDLTVFSAMKRPIYPRNSRLLPAHNTHIFSCINLANTAY